MSSFWRALFGLALVCLALLAVASASLYPGQDEAALADPFEDEEVGETDKRDGLDWDQFVRYQRAAHWSRKYGFASSLDNSVNRYENKMVSEIVTYPNNQYSPGTTHIDSYCLVSRQYQVHCRCYNLYRPSAGTAGVALLFPSDNNKVCFP